MPQVPTQVVVGCASSDQEPADPEEAVERNRAHGGILKCFVRVATQQNSVREQNGQRKDDPKEIEAVVAG